MKEKLVTIGSALAAILASLCCLGPLVLGGVGLGAALVGTFAPLRPYFLALSGALLVLGFYFVYRRPRAEEACREDLCAHESRTRRIGKAVLWLATAAVLALALFPYYGGKFVGRPAAASPIVTTSLTSVELKVSGMTCEACTVAVKSRLLDTAGVAEAEVLYPAGIAKVRYDPTKTDPTKLIATVNATGYQASLATSKAE